MLKVLTRESWGGSIVTFNTAKGRELILGGTLLRYLYLKRSVLKVPCQDGTEDGGVTTLVSYGIIHLQVVCAEGINSAGDNMDAWGCQQSAVECLGTLQVLISSRALGEDTCHEFS